MIEDVISRVKGRIEFAGPHNPVVKKLTELSGNTGPNHEGLFTIQGIWALEQVLEYRIEVISFIFCPELIHSPEAEVITERLISVAKKSVVVSNKVYLKISERDNPDGLAIIGRLPKYSLDNICLASKNLLIILDGLEIPGNVGTIVRSVDGAGGDGVILVNRKVRLNHPKLLRGSHGSSLNIPLIDVEVGPLIEWLKDRRFEIYLTDPRAAKSYRQMSYDGRVAIVAGNEKHGISKQWYDSSHHLISIPMYGRCDSLNVGVATAIVTYEASLKQKC